MLARMVFAGHDPERVMAWPQWVWDVLTDYWPALEADAQLSAIHVAMAPHAKPHQQREIQRELSAYARALAPRRQFAATPDTERDPKQAAEWFAAHGIRVVGSG